MGTDIKFEIPASAIDTFILWNTGALKKQQPYDKLMVEALVFMFLTPEDMKIRKIGDDVSEFIRSFLMIRTDCDHDRMAKIQGYVNEICDEFAQNK